MVFKPSFFWIFGDWMDFDIDKKEIVTFVSLIIFGFVWMIFVVPYLMNSEWFMSMEGFLPYILYNLGFVAMVTVMFGVPGTAFLRKKVDLIGVFKAGLMSWCSYSFIIDLWQTPFLWSKMGIQQIINHGTMVNSSSDYFIGQFWMWGKDIIINIPIAGEFSILFIGVYVITPAIVLIAIAVLSVLDIKRFW